MPTIDEVITKGNDDSAIYKQRVESETVQGMVEWYGDAGIVHQDPPQAAIDKAEHRLVPMQHSLDIAWHRNWFSGMAPDEWRGPRGTPRHGRLDTDVGTQVVHEGQGRRLRDAELGREACAGARAQAPRDGVVAAATATSTASMRASVAALRASAWKSGAAQMNSVRPAAPPRAQA